MKSRIPFEHSTPALYDRFMGPLRFEPCAKVVAERVALGQPDRILETAAGTGIATRALRQTTPHAQIVATDVNPVTLNVAARRPGDREIYAGSVSSPASASSLIPPAL